MGEGEYYCTEATDVVPSLLGIRIQLCQCVPRKGLTLAGVSCDFPPTRERADVLTAFA